MSFLYDKRHDKEIPAKYDAVLNFETDANGETHFKLPEPPPAHFSAQVRMDWLHWKCGCGILGSTDDLARKGIVGAVATTDSKESTALFKAASGEILFAARPLSFIERLPYSIMKE